MGFDPDDPNVHVRFLGSFKNLDEFTAAVTNGDVKLDDQLQLEDLIPEELSHEGLRKRDMNDRAGPILDEVIDELTRAVHEHHAYNSPHEGWAVIKEELDELWDEIKLDEGRGDGARKEALQVAVTAIRYVLDLRPGE